MQLGLKFKFGRSRSWHRPRQLGRHVPFLYIRFRTGTTFRVSAARWPWMNICRRNLLIAGVDSFTASELLRLQNCDRAGSMVACALWRSATGLGLDGQKIVDTRQSEKNCPFFPKVRKYSWNSSMQPNSTNGFGEQNAAQQRFLSLFLRSEREIFRYVAALVPNVSDAEDIVQQTAIALWEKFDAYDPAQPFTPWACRFALNKARQWIERKQRWQTLLENGLAEELIQRREALRPEIEARLKHLENCLGKLPRDQRELVEGYYYHRTGIEPLSESAGRTVQATYKALQRIRQTLLICVARAAGPEAAT